MSALLSTTYRKHITWNGYPADVMKSGLQKYIRRGIVDKALYCAKELDLYKDAPNAKEGEGIRTNFLHRLMIIFMEDVANLSLFDSMYIHMNSLFKEREKEDRSEEKEQEWIRQVVQQLCTSSKARICSHVRAIFYSKYEPLHEQYPSIQALWAEIKQNDQQENLLEHHCALFKRYLKEKNILAVYYAFQIAASEQRLKEKLFRSSQPVWFIFHQLLHPLSIVKTERVKKFVEWYKEHIGGMKEGFMCWLLPLLYELDIVPLGEAQPVKDSPYVPQNRKGEKIDIEDYVLDKHTSKGRGKGLIEFVLNGARVSPEAAFVNPLWKQFYEDGKRWEEGAPILGGLPPTPVRKEESKEKPKEKPKEEPKDSPHQRESEAYEFVVRTQLTTSSTKMDVYFARDNTGKLVVIKGPYSERTEIDILISHTEWKKANGLPYHTFVVRELIPDRWPEGVPLGARNRINRSQPAYFLVLDSYLQESELRTMNHSSTLWPVTEVVDWKQIPFHFTYKQRPLTQQEYKDYIHALLFRYVFGISDWADRNFLMSKGRVISIDEEIENRELDVYATVQKNKAAMIHQWLTNHYDQLEVSQWNVQGAAKQAKLAIIQHREQCLALFAPHKI